MNKQAIWAIARKDIRGITSSIQIWLPMVLVPLILGVVMPAAIIIAIRTIDISSISNMQMIIDVIEKMPKGSLRELLQSFPSVNHKIIYFIVNYLFAPFFLIIPIMASSVISANSFVGEKERKTMEILLLAPIDIKSLFIGKVLAAFIPSMVVTISSFLLYGIVTNVLSYPLFNKLIFPSWNWLILIVWLVPIISLSVILVTVIISAKVKGYQEAYQLSGMMVLPVVALVISQATGLLFLQALHLFAIGLVLLIIITLALRNISKWNNRNALFESQIR